MLKGILALLFLINVIIFAFMFSNSSSPSKQAQKIVTQINPNAIKVITDNKDTDYEVNDNNTTFAANEVSTCVEANLANEAEVTFIQKELHNALSSIQTKIISTTQTGAYMVYMLPKKNFKTQVSDLRRLKVNPISTGLIDQSTVVALGMFADKPRALEYIDNIKLKGVKNLEAVNIQEGNMNVFWLRVPFASLEEEGLLRKIAAKYGILTRFCE
jgi:hypothetical protein